MTLKISQNRAVIRRILVYNLTILYEKGQGKVKLPSDYSLPDSQTPSSLLYTWLGSVSVMGLILGWTEACINLQLSLSLSYYVHLIKNSSNTTEDYISMIQGMHLTRD